MDATLRVGTFGLLLVLTLASLLSMAPLGVLIPALALLLFALYAVIQIAIVPKVRYRHFGYQVDERELDIMQGVFVIRRTLIPLVRVQHVDTVQGPIAKQFGLSSVTVSTAAGGHLIPGLSDQAADELRDRISALARVARESL